MNKKNDLKPKNIKATLKRLFSYLKIHKFKLFFVILCIILSNMFFLVGTTFIGTAIDKYISASNFNGLVKILIFMSSLYILGGVFTWSQSILSVYISQNTVFTIRKELFEKTQKLPLKYFDTRQNGEIMSVVINSVDTISNTLNSSLVQIISSIFIIIGTLIFMFIISTTLTIANLSTIFILLILTFAITKFSKKYFKLQQETLANLNGKIEEIIAGQKVVKVFVREDEETREFEKLNKKLKKVNILAQSSAGFLGPVSTFVNSLSYGVISSFGAILAISGVMKIGSITSFLIFSKQFGRPFSEISNQFNTIIASVAGAEKVFELLDEQEEIKDYDDVSENTPILGNVEFKNVNFSYNKERKILKNINLKADKSEVIALVGPTGAGKTTIINLLTRFYEIDNGEILLDNKNIRNIKRDFLRSNLGIVLQDSYLFSGTIEENIKYGKLDATIEEVKNVAKLANCNEFIEKMPNGYDTILKEDSEELSQGQKQMICIARTILANPSILILDEATSSVDTRTETKIQDAMNKLMEGRTSFVIAHRLSTIVNADKILVINDGQIIERGNHDELIEQKGFYYNLYMKQFLDAV